MDQDLCRNYASVSFLPVVLTEPNVHCYRYAGTPLFEVFVIRYTLSLRAVAESVEINIRKLLLVSKCVPVMAESFDLFKIPEGNI